MLSVVSPSLEQIAGTGVSGAEVLLWIGAAWLWMSLEAGLTEEYLFRAGLQSRLSAWFGSPLTAILIGCVVFGLVHAPGLFLRGGPGTDGWSTDPVQVVAFTIATLSPIGIMLAVLWARTRSLLLVILIHGAIDALPHTAEMIATFR
jgi:membrane protease YdiL (CAAX protease family)